MRAGVTRVLLRGQGVLVIVDGGDLTRGAEVVARHVQGTLAGFTVIGPAQPGVPIEALSTRVAVIIILIIIIVT